LFYPPWNGLSAFKSAELTVAEEDELQKIRNDRSLKLKHPSANMAPLLSLLTGVLHYHEESD
jgi:hypothetical protein